MFVRSSKLLLPLLITAACALLLPCVASAKPKPKLKIGDATATEGQDLTFAVTLKPKAKRTVKVGFATADGSASTTDYDATNGTLKFKKRKTRAEIVVSSKGDIQVEQDEQFDVILLSPTGAKLGDGIGTGTIEDDDVEPVPAISLASGGSIAEGNPGDSGTAGLQATLSQPSSKTVTASWSLTSGAQASDFVSSSGTITFPPGQTLANIGIDVAGDFVEEPDETAVFTIAAPVNATIAAANGTLAVLDDDAGVGDLVITELMPNPDDVADTSGEWVEIFNADDDTVKLTGLKLLSGGQTRCTFAGDLVAGGITLAAGSSNTASNGGLPNVISCAGPLSLLDTAQTVAVSPPAPDPVIDTTGYTSTSLGTSLGLDPDFWTAIGNDSAAHFCPGTVVYFATDLGTPGQSNPQCP